MSRSAKRKDHPLTIRLAEANIAIIDRAASLLGHSRTDFVRHAAISAAHDALMQARPIRMSASGFKAFMEILAAPANAVPAMVDVLRRPTPWEAERSKPTSRPR